MRFRLYLISGIAILLGVICILLVSEEVEGYTPHEPIKINSDLDFSNMASDEGWSGDGDIDTPYIIEGYSIDAEGYGDCIFIGNTTKYFIIRNCYFINADHVLPATPYYTGSGVNIYYVENGIIKNNVMIDCIHGVHTQYSTNNIVESNDITNAFQGVLLWHSHDNIIDSNIFLNNTFGFYFAYEQNSFFSNNSFNLCHMGVRFYSCEGNRFLNNTIENNEYGILLKDESDNNLIKGNLVCSNEFEGLEIENSRDNIIKYNEVRDNGGVGMYMACRHNYIFLNNIINNFNQSYDVGYNQWNNSKGLGNFWSDYTGEDLNDDGIGDTDLPHQGVDYYPLISSYFPHSPISSFTVSPGTGNISQPFQFNATDSSDYEDELMLLMVRWDWENDGDWDTEWSTDKIITYQFLKPGLYNIRLDTIDTDDFTDTVIKQVMIINEPPYASFNTSFSRGNLSEILMVNASSCSDIEDDTSLLLIRWDWEGDNTWDTNWVLNKTATHKYTSPGNYTIKMEVKDTGGLISSQTHNSEVYLDSDGDGFIDDMDAFPYNGSEWNDADNDGIGDNFDVFPTDPSEWIDTDDDGIGNNLDAYPDDPLKWEKEDKGDDNLLFILLIVIILFIVLITIALVIIKHKRGTKPYVTQDVTIFPSLKQISCPNCNYFFEISSEHGSLYVECPNCGTKGIITQEEING